MNENIGLTNKMNQQLADRLRSAQVEFDFYSNGFPITGVEKKSANHLFGNGKWKKTVKEAFGEDVFRKYADKYGEKPIDFQLTALRTGYSNYFLPNERIKISAGNSNKEAKVLEVHDKEYIIIMEPFIEGTQWNSGKIINVSRATGAKSALDRYTLMQSDSKPTIAPIEKNTTPKNVENKSNNFGLTQPQPAVTPKKNYTKTILCLLGIIAAIIIAASVYKQLKNRKQ